MKKSIAKKTKPPPKKDPTMLSGRTESKESMASLPGNHPAVDHDDSLVFSDDESDLDINVTLEKGAVYDNESADMPIVSVAPHETGVPRKVDLLSMVRGGIIKSEVFLDSNAYLTQLRGKPGEAVIELIGKELSYMASTNFYWQKLEPDIFKALTTIDISFCPCVTDLSVRWISMFTPSLKELNVQGCRLVTESALRSLANGTAQLAAANFSMTSVRYIPFVSGFSEDKVTVKESLLIFSTAPKGKVKPENPPKTISHGVVVIIKPVEMRDVFVGPTFAKAEGEVVGSSALLCTYRCENFRIVECTEDFAVHLTLSDNCIIVLPFDANDSNSALRVRLSIQGRFTMAAALVKNFKAIAFPTSKSKLVDQLLTVIREDVNSSSKDKKSSMLNPKYPGRISQSEAQFLCDKDLSVVSAVDKVLPFVRTNLPHADMPTTCFLCFKPFEKAIPNFEQVLSSSPFLTVDYAVKAMSSGLPSDSPKPGWISFISMLTETGNCWLASEFNCDNGPSAIGPSTILSSWPGFVKFLNNLHTTCDTTAIKEDIQCLAPDTPLCWIENVKNMVTSKAITDNDCIRLMKILEAAGAAIFKSRSALLLSCLRAEPPVPLDHYIKPDSNENSSKQNSIEKKLKKGEKLSAKDPADERDDLFTEEAFKYQLSCPPSGIFPSLLALLVKVIPPTLIWRFGAFFYDTPFLEILITFNDSSQELIVTFYTDKLSVDEKTKKNEFSAAVEGSKILVNTICCMVLGKFAFSEFPKYPVYGLDKIRHNAEDENLNEGTFFRKFDPRVARCSVCLMDVNALAAFRRCSLRNLNGMKGVTLAECSSANAAKFVLHLCDWTPIRNTGLSAVQTSYIDIMSIDGIAGVTIQPGHANEELGDDSFQLAFDQNGCLQVESDEKVGDNSKKGKDKNPKQDVKKLQKYLVNGGLRIEASMQEDKGSTFNVSVNGEKVRTGGFAEPHSSLLLTLTAESNSKTILVPVFNSSAPNPPGAEPGSEPVSNNSLNDTTTDEDVIGMYVEAVDIKYPNLICVAHVKEIKHDKGNVSWLISFDNWGSGYDYWYIPRSYPYIFPCGFMEYVKKTNAFESLQNLRGRDSKNVLQKPTGSDYPEDPFPWELYFSDLKHSKKSVNPKPLPLHLFRKDYLIGFEKHHLVHSFRSVGDSQKKQDVSSLQLLSLPNQDIFGNSNLSHSDCTGMFLEAVDVQTPSLICVAHIKKATDKNWIISFDGWTDSYDYTYDFAERKPLLFPCGFMEYINKMKDFHQLSTLRGRSSTALLQKPNGSSYFSNPFNWTKYFMDLKTTGAAKDPKPVPLHLFHSEHLLGFIRYISEKEATATGRDLPDFSALPVRVGMSLEAIDRNWPTMVCACHIKQVRTNEKGQLEWLIAFDNWGDGYDFWYKPKSSSVAFPCGFMEYMQAENKFDLLDEMRGRKIGRGLVKPLQSNYKSDPFPWTTYWNDEKQNPMYAPRVGPVCEPVPLQWFKNEYLFGYENHPIAERFFPGQMKSDNVIASSADVKTLTKYCTTAKQSLLEYISTEKQEIYRHINSIPLPDLNWQLCCWPAKKRLITSELLQPRILCNWPECLHFVNESNEDLKLHPEVYNAMPLTKLASLLILLIRQQRFVPDEFGQLFPHLVTTEKRLDYPTITCSPSNAENAENVLRDLVFPFLLDYISILFYYHEQNKSLITKNPNATSSLTEALKAYYKKLIAPGDEFSRWPAVTISQESPKPKSWLLNMEEAESEFYNHDLGCPQLLCGQHAYHYTTFTKAVEATEPRFDWLSASDSYGHFHDKFITMGAFNKDELSERKQPINQTYPNIHEFLGCLPASKTYENLGILSFDFLTELVLFNNNLTDLPEAFVKYSSTLQRIDLSSNPLIQIPNVIYKLSSLISIRMDYVFLASIDEKIADLEHLRYLSLRYNCLRSLPKSFSNLKALQFLDISGLPSFPSATSSTVYIEEVVSFFERNAFPREAVDNLVMWIESDAHGNELDRSGVQRMNFYLFENLPRLSIKDGQFPLDLQNFQVLQQLRISNTGIVNIPDEIDNLQQLSALDVSGCLKLESISSKIVMLETFPLTVSSFDNCPSLKTPPMEIRKRGLNSIIAYFKRLAEGSVICKRTKLMFVGLGGAGKTSLVHCLLGDKNPSKTKFAVTDGIDIEKWEAAAPDGTKVDFRMWDFAGQVVYYNTHQFFISSRAVYLLLWNIRLGHEHAGLEFWLSSIACHAPNAPILVVGTHSDEVRKEKSFLPEVSYRERFSSICGFHYVSSYSKDGIPHLRQHIIEVALRQKHMGEAIPVAWLKFEGKLNELRETGGNNKQNDKSVVGFNEVDQLADSCGIYEPDEIDQALQFLSDLGSIQYFRTDFLRNRVILNPQWIVDVMACVVSVTKETIIEGRLPHGDISKLWEAYPADLHHWLLKLTEAFDLTFPLKKESVSIVPCLLPETPPESMNFPNLEDHPGHRQTKLIFSFKYLPTGLFNRVQVRLCQFSDGSTIWRKGSLLRKNQHHALITQPDSTSIHVKVHGPCPDNIAFLILEVVDTLIVEAFTGVQPDYLFACPACVNARASNPSMFQRSRIRRAHELRIPFLQCWNFFHSVSTQELRQLFPAETTTEFDSQFTRTLQDISNLKQTLNIDVLVIGCSADANPEEMTNAVSTVEFGKDIIQSLPQTRIVVVHDPDEADDAASFDQLAVLMRSAKLIVFCLSDKFMQSDRCQAAFFTGRETYRKDVLMVFIRNVDSQQYPGLAFQMNDDLYIKAINRNRYKPSDISLRIKQRLSKSADVSSTKTKKEHPSVFISYCWSNSLDAVNKGSRNISTALGVTDPREVKKFLTDNGYYCWLDTEQTGMGGLFRDIADGIRNCKVVLVFASDEYAKSENCLREFHFATTSCRRPVVLCPVGTGNDWQTSEVNLIVSQRAVSINFQVQSKKNYDNLLKAIEKYVKAPEENTKASEKSDDPPEMLGKTGRLKTMSNIQTGEANIGDGGRLDDAKQNSLVLQEMVELGQRKFLRQLIGFNEIAGSQAYPRLVILDIVTVAEDSTEDDEKSSFFKAEWCIKFLCEHEGGWHPGTVSLPIASENEINQAIRHSADYLSQIFNFLKHSAASTLHLLSPNSEHSSKICQAILQEIEKMTNPEPNFEHGYRKFLEFVTSSDFPPSYGGLSKVPVSRGKELWLCQEHQAKSGNQIDEKDEKQCDNNKHALDAERVEAGKKQPINIRQQFRSHRSQIYDLNDDKNKVKDQHQETAANKVQQKTTSRACLIQ